MRLIYANSKIRAVYINYCANNRRKDQILETLLSEYNLNPELISSKPTVIRVMGEYTPETLSKFSSLLEKINVTFVSGWDDSVQKVVEIVKE